MFKIEKKEVSPGIFSLRFRTQYEACSTMMRIQEFYESPFKKIRGHVFTLEEYMDEYAKATGNFTYTIDWGGFNVPDSVFRAFFDQFDLLEKEKHLKSLFTKELASDQTFYVIGHYEDKIEEIEIESTLAHEIAHGKFYLDPEYKKESLKLVKDLVKKDKIAKALIDMGYTKNVINDEVQAYMATSSPAYLKHLFGVGLAKESKKFRKLLTKYMPA